MEQQGWKYESFLQFYEAWNNFFVRTGLETGAEAYNGFLQSTEWNSLPLESQEAASVFLDADEKEVDEMPFLLDATLAQDYYLKLCRENYPAGKEIPMETVAYWKEQFSEKEFSALIAPMGHKPRYSGIFRKKVGEAFLIFPYFADGLASSRYLLSKIASTILISDLPLEQWISTLQLQEREAVAGGVERSEIVLQMDSLTNKQLETATTDPQKKALLLQKVFFHFRAERPEDGYIYWNQSLYRQTTISLNQLASFLDRSGMELEQEEWAVCCWIRFVILRSRNLGGAVKQAHLVLENAAVLVDADAFPLLGGLATVPVDQQFKQIILRRLQDDFRDIAVSYLLEYYVAKKNYWQAYRILDGHDRFFHGFLQDYREAAQGKATEQRSAQEEAEVKQLFQAQQERLQVVLGEGWLMREKETHEEEAAIGTSVRKDAFQGVVKYIYNAMNVFHAVEEEELGVFLNKIYLHLMMAE